MIDIKTNKILIPIDFSNIAQRALRHGAFIAQRSKGELVLLHVQKKRDLLDVILPAFKTKSTSKVKEFLQEKLEKLAEAVRKEYNVRVKPIVAIGNIASEIAQTAEKEGADLIIMGTQGGDSTNDFFLGSNAYRVLTKSAIPVMTVRSDTPRMGYENILLPIDSSAHSRQKVNSALQIADKFSSGLHVLGLLGIHEENYEYKLRVILPQIQKMAKASKLACTAAIEQAVNRAEKTLAYAKKVKADLIIIMADQHAELSSLMLGTYAHQLINNSKIPVLSIPPEVHPENLEMDSIGGMW